MQLKIVIQKNLVLLIQQIELNAKKKVGMLLEKFDKLEERMYEMSKQR